MAFSIQKKNLIPTSHSNIKEFYRFQSVTLGQGSYGFVRPAWNLNDNSRRAVKIIPKKRIKNHQILTREIQVMKKIDHPYIVKLFQTFQDSRYVYLVEQLCTGGELFDTITQRGHLDQNQAAHIFRQMVEAVQYLHSLNIVHRDLKPQNFLFSQNWPNSPLKLIDFGLAKVMKPGTLLTTKTGTCYYISPETLSGAYTEKCDIWSLGVILFMMLSGYPPFDGKTDREIIQKVRTKEFSFNENV